jgi:hypothetical protein
MSRSPLVHSVVASAILAAQVCIVDATVMSPVPPLEWSLSGGSRLIDQGGSQPSGLDHERSFDLPIPLPGPGSIAPATLTGRNAPFNPLCAATSYAAGSRVAFKGNLELGTTSRTGMLHHADATPSSPGQATAAVASATVRLRAHHRGPGRHRGLSHPAAPPTHTTPAGTRPRAAHPPGHTSTDSRLAHHHSHP